MIKLNFHSLPENSESLIIRANKFLLASALGNIFENAVKFSKNLPVTCNLNSESNSIHISISDQGIGIPADNIKDLFQPFYRARNARSFSGHGIGLALAQKIIRVHGGTISVQSKIDEGAVFTVTLPTIINT